MNTMTLCEHSIETPDYVKVGEFMNISVVLSAQDEVCFV